MKLEVNYMADATAQIADEKASTSEELTDGFNLVIDALKVNDINTIYNLSLIHI